MQIIKYKQPNIPSHRRLRDDDGGDLWEGEGVAAVVAYE